MTCGHKECNCQVGSTRTDGFCSDQCATGGTGSSACLCGHPGCAPKE
jgi:hypothetical protein